MSFIISEHTEGIQLSWLFTFRGVGNEGKRSRKKKSIQKVMAFSIEGYSGQNKSEKNGQERSLLHLLFIVSQTKLCKLIIATFFLLNIRKHLMRPERNFGMSSKFMYLLEFCSELDWKVPLF